jgi:uncharacterized repeat protein (TIGR03803 family)
LLLAALIYSPISLVGVLLLDQPAQAQTLTTLHSFTGYPDDGAYPYAGVVLDAEGNLYGTTQIGGKHCYRGCGIVFKLTPTGEESILYSFYSGAAAFPESSLFFDASGNLYGTTVGGNAQGAESPTYGGSVFKLKKQRNLQDLYSFTQTAVGLNPMAGLVADAQGNLYGTTNQGGNSQNCDGYPDTGCGVIFKVTPAGVETVLHSFNYTPDGSNPRSTLVLDADGNLYGTAGYGGGSGAGVVFEVTASGNFTVLHTFTRSPDGSLPFAGLAMDAKGNLFGTTVEGGALSCDFGCGTVFRVAFSGKETVLYRFRGAPDGANPYGSLVLDADGNLYGTTGAGGANNQGTVFKLGPNGKETILYSFCSQTNCTDGAGPNAGVSFDAQGNLYGTTLNGGVNNNGTVFKLTP